MGYHTGEDVPATGSPAGHYAMKKQLRPATGEDVSGKVASDGGSSCERKKVGGNMNRGWEGENKRLTNIGV